jgi:RNA polymerase sigma-70 factor (ECF subfamily)
MLSMSTATVTEPTSGARTPQSMAPRNHRNRPRDQDLPAGVQAGDPQAIEALILAYRPLMHAYLRSILRHEADAEDVLQACVIEVWSRARSFDPERGSLRTWLLTICRSRALDQLRRRIPEPRDPASLGTLVGHAEDEELEDALERWRIADCLRRLPRREATLLRLRFGEGLSQREIAERTGIPLGTVKTAMVRALRTLRELLGAEEAAVPGGTDLTGATDERSARGASGDRPEHQGDGPGRRT